VASGQLGEIRTSRGRHELITPENYRTPLLPDRYQPVESVENLLSKKGVCQLTADVILHHRDAEFAEIGIFLDQKLFTLRPPRLRGEISETFFTTEIQSSQSFLSTDRGALLLDHVPIVLNVVGQLMFCDGPKAGPGEIFARLFFAPHRPQPFTTLRQ